MTEATAPDVVVVMPSRLLAGWIVAAAAASIVPCVLFLPLLPAAVAGSVVLGAAGMALRRYALLRHPHAITAVRCGSRQFEYRLQSNAWHSGTILADSVVTRWLTVVRIQDDEPRARRRVLVLCLDSLQPEDFRRLRVCLRWRPAGERGNTNQ
jgi:hypothetical protein